MEKALDGQDLLVGVSGQDALRDAFSTIFSSAEESAEEQFFDFINKFRQVRGLHYESIDPVIDLLEAGGISRNRAAKEIMNNMVNLMRQKINTLSQTHLTKLLEASYTYLTVPELAPVPIAAVENLREVRSSLWTEIVANGLEGPPYVDLPLSIKRRIWVQETHAFEHELDLLISKVEQEPPPLIENLIRRKPFDVRKRESKVLKDLLQMVLHVGENLILMVAEKLYDKANMEQSPAKRTAIANLFHDFIQAVPVRCSISSLTQAKKIVKALDKPASGHPDQDALRELHGCLSLTTSYPLMVLLVASSYTRDFIADHLVTRLSQLVLKMKGHDDQDPLQKASRLIQNDMVLQNLTYICIFSMRVGAVLNGTDVVQEAEIEPAFTTFYPVLMSEMYHDYSRNLDDYYNEDVSLPSEKLSEMPQQGRLERRVITTYCMQLMQKKNVIGVSRFHLILDHVLKLCDPDEEQRETALAYGAMDFGMTTIQ